jgi:hypothetical protein
VQLSNGSPAVRLYFPFTIFLSAFLLFQVQPIMGRYILPWFGGGPAVWSNCLLFFQVVLLGGYAYAHWLGSRPDLRLQALVHIALLLASLFFLPIGPHAASWKPAAIDNPSGRILLLLAATVGGPYLMLSATGPLLQRWLTLVAPGKTPWSFYALSNLGSFVALLSYPFAIEPFLRLPSQGWIWSVLYAAFVILCGWTGWRMSSAAVANLVTEPDNEASRRPKVWTVLFWLALSTCSSILLVATTNQLSQDIAVNPFLWVAALSVYLLTFILAFYGERAYNRTLFAVAAGLFAPVACVVPSLTSTLSLRSQLALYLAALFIGCMLCHGELARSRPPARYLTQFYLAIAAGGAIGGVFVALVAPRIFSDFSEYPIGLATACLLGFLGWLRSGALKQWTSQNLAVRIPLMALLLGGLTAIVAAVAGSNQTNVATARNFYGILRVTERADSNGPLRELRHGQTRHGLQYLNGPQRTWPTTYYGPHSGVAIALNALDRSPRRVGIIGLGTGTMAAWGRPEDTFRFYEINPDVETIAQKWFTFLKDSKARTQIVLGDARIQLERELSSGLADRFDLLAVDAFSSDAIPVHLLTAECADVYRRRLTPGGLLLLHISNRALDLEPVARGMAQYLGWKAVQFISGDDPRTGESSSRWVLMTANTDFLERTGMARQLSGWGPRPPLIWTDDFASLWHVLRF